ncbi:uncharacterized protein [Procambarus clarkii]|nr:uncharacterized protein LOC123757266 isoform X2 [Procambarus clarkii]
MHCLLPTRVLYNASRTACGVGSTNTSQVRDGVSKLLRISPDTLSHTNCLRISWYSTRTIVPGTCLQVNHSRPRTKETSSQNALNKEEAAVGKFENVFSNFSISAKPNELSEMNSKRTRDLLSPLRPIPQKKIKSISRTSKVITDSAVLDFIPLPPSPPRENDDLGEFIVIDTRPSEVVFPQTTSGNKCNKENSSNAEAVSKKDHGGSSSSNVVNSVEGGSNGECSGTGSRRSDEVIVSCDSDIIYVPATSESETSKLCDKKNNRTKERTKFHSKRNKSKSVKPSEDNDINILFESPSKNDVDEIMVVCTISAPEKGQDHMLSPGRKLVPGNQRRKCHSSTRQGLKAKPMEEVSAPSNLDIKEKNVSDYKNMELSPDIQKVNVVDPDVVEIVEDPASSSSSRSIEVEVIDVYMSDQEDKCSTTSSDHETRDMDISNSEFISLQKLRVKDLENTEIDISDEVLKLRRELEDLRKWEMTGLGQEILSGKNMKPTDVMFTILSYNVLAQALLTDNMSLYKCCEEEHLSWDYRWALLQHEINDLDPDVLMLQEVQASHYHSHYLPWFTYQGYDGLFKKRTGIKTDGCAIFFKKNKFSLLEHSSVEYLQPEARNVLDRDNIGLIAKLLPVSQPNSAPLCIATTHLLYNPNRHDVKLAQIVLLLSEIDRLSYEGEKGGITKYCPVIVTGDFNAEPHSSLIQFLKEGRLQYEGLARKTLTRHGAIGSLLGPELFPQSLGLTDRCQHAVLAQSRYLENTRGPIFSLSDKRRLEESLIHLYHSDRECLPHNNSNTLYQGRTPSGWFSHGFNFHSVYRHRLNRLGRAPEATTHQNGWTTVDYMLYSRNYSSSLNRPVEGNLKLLARYGLLSGPEADRFAPLPSSVCPSDHFPLAAQFLLRK